MFRLRRQPRHALHPFALQRTAAAGEIGAQRRQGVVRRERQGDIFFHHAQNELDPVGDADLAIQTFTVGVNGVRRNAKISGDSEFGAIVKNATHDLQFTSG